MTENILSDYINGTEDISKYSELYLKYSEDWFTNKNKDSLWQTYPIWVNALKTYMNKYLKGKKIQFFNDMAEEGALQIIERQIKNPNFQPKHLLAYASRIAKSLLWGNGNKNFWVMDSVNENDDIKTEEVVQEKLTSFNVSLYNIPNREDSGVEKQDKETMITDLKNRCNFLRDLIRDLFNDEARNAIPADDKESLSTFDYYKKGTEDIYRFMNKLYDASYGAI